MYGFKWYERLFLISLPVALLSLLTPSLNWLYAVVFFAASFPVVFEFGKPQQNIQHSSVTHFDRSSRWNRISYAKCAYLVFSALTYGLLPHLGPVLIFALWLGGLAGLWYAERKWEPQLLGNLLVEYICTKLPQQNVAQVKKTVNAYLKRGELPEDAADAEIRHYLETYLANNL